MNAREEILHRCPVCELHYKNEETARRCEAWCREHKSCNLEIIADAVENTGDAPGQ